VAKNGKLIKTLCCFALVQTVAIIIYWHFIWPGKLSWYKEKKAKSICFCIIYYSTHL